MSDLAPTDLYGYIGVDGAASRLMPGRLQANGYRLWSTPEDDAIVARLEAGTLSGVVAPRAFRGWMVQFSAVVTEQRGGTPPLGLP